MSKPGTISIWDKQKNYLFMLFCGIQHTGGVILQQAFIRNVRNRRHDTKGKFQVGAPTRKKVQMRGTVAEQLVVVMKPL